MQIQKFNWIIRRAGLYNAGPVYGFGHCNIGDTGSVLARKRTLTMPVRLDQYNYPPPPPSPPPTPHLGLREATSNLGLYNPYLDSGKSKNSIGVALMWLAFAVVGLMVAALLVFSFGIRAPVFGCVLGVPP